MALKPLAPESSAWCTLQKTRNLNGYSLLCISLDNDIRCHFIFSKSHCTLTTVIFQCQELQAKYAYLKNMIHCKWFTFSPCSYWQHTHILSEQGDEQPTTFAHAFFTGSSFMNGSKEHHPPEIQFKSHPGNCKVHIPQQVKA